jgi:hypothetical protein
VANRAAPIGTRHRPQFLVSARVPNSQGSSPTAKHTLKKVKKTTSRFSSLLSNCKTYLNVKKAKKINNFPILKAFLQLQSIPEKGNKQVIV